MIRTAGRFALLLLLSAVALQLSFVLRIALMVAVDPQSSSFERSEIWRLATERGALGWRQEWRPYARIAEPLKRAVIAAEDASFAEHTGIDWEALEKAWERNQRAAARAQKMESQRPELRDARGVASKPSPPARAPRIVGGSTITQQLAKNLFLSGERSLVRKGQEFVLTYLLETLLGKRRILEIYLNHVEWGEGVFGAQAASQHYFRIDADRLGPLQAARLAVMLPAPKRFEKRPGSAYVSGRAATIVARMGSVDPP